MLLSLVYHLRWTTAIGTNSWLAVLMDRCASDIFGLQVFQYKPCKVWTFRPMHDLHLIVSHESYDLIFLMLKFG